jgi:hypothetical protein
MAGVVRRGDLTAAALAALLAGLSSCPGDQAPENPLRRTHELIGRPLDETNVEAWNDWTAELTAVADPGADVRIALGQMYLAFYRNRAFVQEHADDLDSIEAFADPRQGPSGRALLAEAAWWFTSVVSENWTPVDRQTAAAHLIEVLREKNRAITSSVAAGIVEEHGRPLTEIKRRFLELGLTHLEIVLLSGQWGTEDGPKDVGRLRQALELHADWMNSIAQDAAPNPAFEAYFRKREREERRMIALEPEALRRALEEEPWKVLAFARMSPGAHLKQAFDAKTQVSLLRNQGADRVMIYEQMEKTLLHTLYLMEGSCRVHRGDEAHPGAISEQAMDEASSALYWILSVAETVITQPE